MKEKYDFKKIVIDLGESVIGIIGSGFLTFTFYNILKYGGVKYSEPNKPLLLAELGLFAIGTTYFTIKGIKIATGIDRKKYLK